MNKVLLTGRSPQEPNIPGYNRGLYNALELDAAEQAGFEVIEISFYDLVTGQAMKHDLAGTAVLTRHAANQDYNFKGYVTDHGGELLVPDYDKAGEWYKIVPLHEAAARWLGGRSVSWVDVPETTSEVGDGLPKAAEVAEDVIDRIFDPGGPNGRMFAKAPHKQDRLQPRVYDKDALFETLRYALTYGRLREVIYSEPMDIAAEYRALIVTDEPSTISRSSDDKGRRHYDEIEEFAADFSEALAGHLPHSYCLDIARLTTGGLAVVELNEIGGTGFFADHDIYKFYRDLAGRTADSPVHYTNNIL